MSIQSMTLAQLQQKLEENQIVDIRISHRERWAINGQQKGRARFQEEDADFLTALTKFMNDLIPTQKK
jgi:hypothetical protein